MNEDTIIITSVKSGELTSLAKDDGDLIWGRILVKE